MLETMQSFLKKKKQSLKRLQRLCSVITLCSILEAKFKEFTNEILPQDQLQRVLEIMWEHKLKSRILKINIQSCCHILQEKLNIISIIVKPTSSRVKQKSTIENWKIENNLPQNKLVPVIETGIDQVLDSDNRVVLSSPCKQDNFVPQILNLFIKLQVWCYCRGSYFPHPLIKLRMIKNFQPVTNSKTDLKHFKLYQRPCPQVSSQTSKINDTRDLSKIQWHLKDKQYPKKNIILKCKRRFSEKTITHNRVPNNKQDSTRESNPQIQLNPKTLIPKSN